MSEKIVYPAIFEYDGKTIGVYFPDLPGCVTSAKTEADALECAREALLFHLEGLLEDGDALPAATDSKKIKTRRNEQITLIDVASPQKVERINITMTAADLARIDTLAAKARLSRSAYLVKAAIAGHNIPVSK